VRHFHDLFHACLDDTGEILDRDLLGALVAYTWYGYKFIGTCFFRDRAAKAGLELFRLLRKYAQPLLYIIGDNVATKRNDRRVPYYVVIKDGYVGSPATDIDEANAGLLFVFTQRCQARCKRFKDEVLDFKTCPANAFVHIVDGIGLSGDDVKIRLQPYARHADWFFDAVFVVDHVVLWHHMNNLASRRNHHPVHVLGKTLDIAYRDLIILRGAGNDAVLNKTADMLTGNPHVNYPDIN